VADDVAITAGVGTTVATDEIGGRHYQLIKMAFGAVDSASLVSAALPFPMQPGLKTTEQLTRAAISCASSGDNIIVAADVANKIRIYAMLFTVASPVNVKLGEGGPTYWTGAMTFGLGGGFLLSQQGEPHFMTSAINKSILLNLSAAVQASGVIWYTAAP
jgi:hypothetical protein